MARLRSRQWWLSKVDDVQPVQLDVLVDNFRIVLLADSPLFGLRRRIKGGEGQGPTDRRPSEAADVRFEFGQLHRLTPVKRDDPQILLADARRHERDPLPVGRPLRVVARLVPVRQLPRLTRIRVDQMNVRPVLADVALHHRLTHGEGDPPAVRRNHHAADSLHLHHQRRRPHLRWTGVPGRDGGSPQHRPRNGCQQIPLRACPSLRTHPATTFRPDRLRHCLPVHFQSDSIHFTSRSQRHPTS